MLKATVSDFRQNGRWNIPSFLLDNFNHIFYLVLQVAIPISHEDDHLIWSKSHAGDLQLKDSYMFLYPK